MDWRKILKASKSFSPDCLRVAVQTLDPGRERGMAEVEVEAETATSANLVISRGM